MSFPIIPDGIPSFTVELSLAERSNAFTVPVIKVFKDRIPAETKKIHLVMEDTDLGNFFHGAQLLPFEDADILLQDSFTIIPLTPPPGSSHHYRLTVRALDSDFNVIGCGYATQLFSG